MVDLPESSASYPTGVRQIDSGEKAFGGDTTKPPNEQLLSLASRTAFLKAQVDAINTEIADINTALDGLTIGEEVQGYDTTLQGLSDLALLADRLFGTASGSTAIALRAIPSVAIAVLQDNKASFGGTGNTTNWLTRDLNAKEEIGATFCTLASNQFTLPAGTYLLIARVPATMVDKHQARLYNVTDAAIAKVGSSTQTLTPAAVSGQSFTTDSWIITTFTLAATKTFRIEHRIYDTITDRSLGAEVGTGLGEVYTQVAIAKISNS